MVETIVVAPAPGAPMETMSKPIAAKNPEVGGKDSQAGTALECSGRSGKLKQQTRIATHNI